MATIWEDTTTMSLTNRFYWLVTITLELWLIEWSKDKLHIKSQCDRLLKHYQTFIEELKKNDN